MNYALLANLTALTHITIVVGVLVGLLACYRYRRFRPWEAATLLIVVLLWSYYGNCPFTILEQHFRDLAGQHTNLTAIGFLPYYAHKFLNISLQSRTVIKSTYFVGGMFFLASIEWFSPFMHYELFRVRKTLKNLRRKRKIGKHRP